MRHFNDQLAQVAGELADERADLGCRPAQPRIALDSVANFVKAERGADAHRHRRAWRSITGVLVKDKAALNEALVAGPVALSNLTHGYQETTGTLGTRSNLVGLTTPTGLRAAVRPAHPRHSALAQSLLGATARQINQAALLDVCHRPSAPASSRVGNNLSGLTATARSDRRRTQ